MNLLLKTVFIFLILYSFNTLAFKTDSTQRTVFSLGIQTHYGSIFAHSRDVQNTDGANPVGISLISTWKFIDKKTWQNCRCAPRLGFYLSYYDYDVKLLDKGIIGSYFLEPNFKITKRLTFNFRGSFGLAYLTNPYHPTRNPTNQSYSLPLNAFIGLGVGLNYRISNHIAISAFSEYKHISNGGLQDPNKGINWPVASLGIEYIFNYRDNYIPYSTLEKTKNKTRIDFAFYIGNKTLKIGEKGRYFVLGAYSLISKPISTINALTLGLDFYYDFATKELLERQNSKKDPFGLSILTGHEFLLGKFIFSQHIGWYIYQDTPFYPFFFHRWGVSYRFVPNLNLGFDLKAHYQVADYVNAKIIYHFTKP